jgi:hypothetical protein
MVERNNVMKGFCTFHIVNRMHMCMHAPTCSDMCTIVCVKHTVHLIQASSHALYVIKTLMGFRNVL